MDRVVIDVHLHLWNTGRLLYEWLQRPENAAINRTFGFEDWGEHATEFLATGTAVRRLADEHKLPDTTPKPTFTLGLDS